MTDISKMNKEFNKPRDTATGSLYIEPVKPSNFRHLIPLVDEQAQHHSTKFTGCDKKFYDAFFKETPVIPNAYFVCATDRHFPLAYVLFTEVMTNHGRAFHMEDICVRKEDRGHLGHKGVGSRAVSHLIDTALDRGCFSIIWVVAQNNPIGRKFYENRIGAPYIGHTNFDMDHLFQKQNLPPLPQKLVVKTASLQDIAEIAHRRKQEPYHGTKESNDQHLKALRESAIDPRFMLLVVRDTATGSLASYTIANANYSSFRTVTGLELEDTCFLGNIPESRRKEIMNATVIAAAQIAQNKNWTGHLRYLTDDKIQFQASHLRHLGGAPLTMTEDPASTFLTMNIGSGLLTRDLAMTLRGETISPKMPLSLQEKKNRNPQI